MAAKTTSLFQESRLYSTPYIHIKREREKERERDCLFLCGTLCLHVLRFISVSKERKHRAILGMHRGKEETICLHFSKANLRVNNDNETYENTRKWLSLYTQENPWRWQLMTINLITVFRGQMRTRFYIDFQFGCYRYSQVYGRCYGRIYM